MTYRAITLIPYQCFIKASCQAIIDAGRLVNDSQACAEEAKRIYRKDSRGMWKKIQKDARLVLQKCNEHNLTIERPYKVINGMVYCVSMFSGFFPAFGKERCN